MDLRQAIYTLTVLALCGAWSTTGKAQDREVAPTGRIHQYEAASTGYFREQDTLPGAYQLYLQSPAKGALWGGGPTGGDVKRISFQADAHVGVRGYGWQRCTECHEQHDRSLHSTRGEVTCVQCHRDQPTISGIYHYYSPMNPIRRHAYICAKCHEGSSASFASYVIHEPNPLARETAQSFPIFYYAVWFMVILTVGVFIIFIPYTALWGIRELVALITRRTSGGKRQAV